MEDPDERWVVETMSGIGVGIGDDCAVLEGQRLLTTDAMVEGVHWDDRLDAEDVGFKLVAVNVSDIAAMGGRPEWALLDLLLPAPLERRWVEHFARGLRAACTRWGITLVGGDTTRSPVRVASLTLGGRATRPVPRSGGRPGDRLFVTGTLGRAAAGFLEPVPDPRALAWLRRPEPPAAFGASLAEAGLATAMMDLSDGLAVDLARLCAASGCGAEVDPDALPGSGPLAWRTSFGEDYELLFAAPASCADAVASLAKMEGIRVTGIGALDAGRGARLRGRDWPAPLYAHFPGARERAP